MSYGPIDVNVIELPTDPPLRMICVMHRFGGFSFHVDEAATICAKMQEAILRARDPTPLPEPEPPPPLPLRIVPKTPVSLEDLA